MTNIKNVLDQMDFAVLEFSGGKDSIATALLCYPWKDKIKLVHVDMGDEFPHVTKYIETFSTVFHYELVTIHNEEKIEDYWERVGIPADNVNYWKTKEAEIVLGVKSEKRFQHPGLCCGNRLWFPLQDYVYKSKTNVVIRGSKGTDSHITAPNGFLDQMGVMYISPIWDWTDKQVFEFIDSFGCELPHQYQVGCVHSLDCMRCPAWLNTESEKQRLAYTRDFYPETLERIKEMLAETQKILVNNVKQIHSILEM